MSGARGEAGSVARDPSTGRDSLGSDDTLLAPPDSAVGRVPEQSSASRRDRYDLGPLLGRGGMGEVVAAHDRHLDRDVAIKRLHAGSIEAAALARFVREAKIQARLEHPAVAPIHEFDHDANGQPFLVMKRIRGTTLADTLKGVDRDNLLEIHRLLAAFGQVCLAIDYAHARGVVHRDLKPANIILGDYGDVYVLDWGVAKVLGGTESFTDGVRHAMEEGEALTSVGGLVGTPGYMAPEQLLGAEVDGRADVYALGCVLFEILAGVRMHALDRLLVPVPEEERRPSRRGSAVAPELDDLCVHATEREPARRVASARELKSALDRYLAGDRDLARRRELAGGCVELAERTLSAGESAGARTTAMRAASQALALDPDNARASRLVARLLLEPPVEVPVEVAASLAAARAERISHYGRIGIGTFLTTVLFLPFVLVMGVRQPWLFVAFGLVSAAGIAAAAQCVNGRGGRWSPYAVLVAGALLVAVTSRVFSSFFVAPLLAFAWATVSFVHPARLSVGAIIGAFSVATIGPPVFEVTGVVAPTGRFAAGVLVIDNAGVWFPRVPTLVTFAIMIGGGLSMVANILVGMRRKLDEEERARALQAWQLERGLPASTLEESRSKAEGGEVA